MPRCPSCFSPLTRTEDGDTRYSACGNCFGTWITTVALLRQMKTDLAKALKPAGNAPGENAVSPDDIRSACLADLAEVVHASDSKAMLRCPQCEKFMQKDRFHPMIPVQIDRCRPCSSIWLDAGELSLLRRLYVEMMTSTNPEILHRREKVAAITAPPEARKAPAPDAKEATRSGTTDPNHDTGFDLLKYLLTRQPPGPPGDRT